MLSALLPPPRPPGLLSDNNRLSELGRIVAKFEEIAADQRGEVSHNMSGWSAGGGGRTVSL